MIINLYIIKLNITSVLASLIQHQLGSSIKDRSAVALEEVKKNQKI